MKNDPAQPKPAPQPLRSLNCIHDPQTGQVLLEINGESIVLLSARHLEGMLAALGQIRSEMQPPIPDTAPPPDPVHPRPVLDRMALATQGDMPAIRGGAILSVRSSFYGWQSMEMHPEFCRKLAHDLLGYAPLTPDVPPNVTLN